VRNAKIIIALRYDLLDRVIRLARGAGFQEEKYESLYLELVQTKSQLTDVLDSRIERLVRQSYTNQKVSHKDVLPRPVDKKPALDYMMERTLMRPRDIIMFFNACIRQARDNPLITPRMLKDAEGEYSRQRLRSLADEWVADYPYLMSIVNLLKGRYAQFPLSDISDDDCYTAAIELSQQEILDEELRAAVLLIERETINTGSLRCCIASILYRVGVIGLKLERFESAARSSGRRTISSAEISPATRLSIHPCFWRCLGINPDRNKQETSAELSMV
jgi:hypothetical protein